MRSFPPAEEPEGLLKETIIDRTLQSDWNYVILIEKKSGKKGRTIAWKYMNLLKII